MLSLISAVLTDLMKQGVLARNVAELVDRMPTTKRQMRTFTPEEVRRVLAHVENDRIGVAWHLALSGLRRGEIAGLHWETINFENNTITVSNNRVSVNGQAVEGETKTAASARTLPLTPELTRVLRRTRAIQAAERLRIGDAWGPGTHVVVDEAGRPYHPDTLSTCWRSLCAAAGVSRIRLHDARHTCATLMHLQGVPIAVISAWLGHTLTPRSPCEPTPIRRTTP